MTALWRLLIVTVWSASLVWLIVALAQIRRERALARHVDEAIDLTLPLGPEDYPQWSDPR